MVTVTEILASELRAQGISEDAIHQAIRDTEGYVRARIEQWKREMRQTSVPVDTVVQIWRAALKNELQMTKQIIDNRPSLLYPHGTPAQRPPTFAQRPGAPTAAPGPDQATAESGQLQIVNKEPIRRIVNMLSNYRNHLVDPLPNDFSMELSRNEMPDYVIEVVLRHLHIPAAFDTYNYSNNAIFYVLLSDVSTKHAIQNDNLGKQSHFKCHSYLDFDTNYPRIFVDTNTITFPTAVKLNNLVRVSILNAQKLPLLMEQDIYTISSAVLDVPNARTIFTIGIHSLTGGDPILIRGLTIDADRSLYADSKYLRAIVLTPTTIAVSEFVAAGNFEYQNPRVISKARNVEIDLEFHYLRGAETSVDLTGTNRN